MSRTREFNPDETLQTAIRVFWEKGYSDTSVDEIVERSGVAKYGIYGVFGTKRELFKKALVQFGNDRRGDIQRPLRKPEAALPEIQAFFRKAPKMMLDKRNPRGCLIVNTGIELGSEDPEILDFVKSFFRDLRRVMEGCLERAVEQGQLRKSTDVAALARYLVTEFRCALMLARSGHSRRDIESHLRLALHVLH